MVLNHTTEPVFMPWLFDDKEAWEKAVVDPRYSYDMPIDLFMHIYLEYRNGKITVSEEEAESIAAGAFSSAQTNPKKSEPAGDSNLESAEILSQNEIDSLLTGL